MVSTDLNKLREEVLAAREHVSRAEDALVTARERCRLAEENFGQAVAELSRESEAVLAQRRRQAQVPLAAPPSRKPELSSSPTAAECDKSETGDCDGPVSASPCPHAGCVRVARRCAAHGGEAGARRSTGHHAGKTHSSPGPGPVPTSIPASMLREPAGRPTPAAEPLPATPAADLLVPAARPAPGRPLPRSSGRSSSSSGGSR